MEKTIDYQEDSLQNNFESETQLDCCTKSKINFEYLAMKSNRLPRWLIKALFY